MTTIVGLTLLANFCHQEFGKWLTVTIGAAVVLLWLHLVHNHFRTLHILHNFRFHRNAFKIGLPHMELASMLQCQHAAQLDFATLLSLHKIKCESIRLPIQQQCARQNKIVNKQKKNLPPVCSQCTIVPPPQLAGGHQFPLQHMSRPLRHKKALDCSSLLLQGLRTEQQVKKKCWSLDLIRHAKITRTLDGLNWKIELTIDCLSKNWDSRDTAAGYCPAVGYCNPDIVACQPGKL